MFHSKYNMESVQHNSCYVYGYKRFSFVIIVRCYRLFPLAVSRMTCWYYVWQEGWQLNTVHTNTVQSVPTQWGTYKRVHGNENCQQRDSQHYNDVIMDAMASQITGVAIVSAVCSGADQRKHQSSTSLAFFREIHRWPVNSPHIGPVTRKMFPFDDVIMKRMYEDVTCRCQLTSLGATFTDIAYHRCKIISMLNSVV